MRQRGICAICLKDVETIWDYGRWKWQHSLWSIDRDHAPVVHNAERIR